MEFRFHMKLGTRLLVLFCLMFIGFIVISELSAFIASYGLLAMITLQDVLAFIVPAILAMTIFYRHPLHTMCLDKAPSWRALAVVALFYVVSLPAMNWLVAWNEALSLPSWLSDLESIMRTMEDSAAKTTEQLLNIHTVRQLLSCVIVVGLMAGLSEEILFRGAMLRTMQDSRWNTHVIVWTTAIIFSAFHLQFFGFVPRMILGVWLGYLLVWTRSLWVPIIAHTLNNSTVMVLSFLANKGIVAEDFGDNLGLPSPGAFPWVAIASVIVSVILAIWASHMLSNKHQSSEAPS